MWRPLPLALALVALATFAMAGEWGDDSAVHELGADTLPTFVAEHDHTLVMFYAPWCGHCKNAKPGYGAASHQLRHTAAMAAVDCTVHEDLCKEYDVSGYPSFKYFAKGAVDAPEDYEGGRDTASFVSFLKPRAEKTLLDNVDGNTDFGKLKLRQLKKILADRGLQCVACTEKHEFVKMARDSWDKPKVDAGAGAGAAKPKKPVETHVGRTWAQDNRAKKARAAAEKGWHAEAHGNGAVRHETDDSFDEFRKATQNFLAFFGTDWCGHCKALKPHFAAASLKLDADGLETSFVYIDCELNPERCQQYDIKSYPTLKWFGEGAHADDHTPEQCDASRTEKGLLKWVREKLGLPAPAAEPYKNEPLWEENGKVFHVGDDHWEEFRANHPKLLALFYAPWCGHCKAFKPAFVEASEAVAEDVALVAVDCTEHSETCGRFGVTGYPSTRWFASSDDAEGEDFDGARTKDGVLEFVNARLGGAAKDEL